jgi:hypothetical protein
MHAHIYIMHNRRLRWNSHVYKLQRKKENVMYVNSGLVMAAMSI